MKETPESPHPPKWAIRCLEWFCPDELVEGILGDLWEEYEVDLEQFSTKKANRRFAWNTLRFFHPSIILRNHLTVNFINMGILKNYVKVALRSFWRQKLTTAINVFGLTIGLTCASLAYIFMQFELSYDKFHHQSDTVYSLMTRYIGNINFISTPGPLAASMVVDLPEVTDGIRMQGKKILVSSENELYNEEALFTDANFFDFFDFKLLKGSSAELLKEVNSTVISKAMALKYFGSNDPIGQSISLHLDGQVIDFIIRGVAENPPNNSSIQYKFLLPIQHLIKENPATLDTNWDGFPVKTFIRLNDRNELANLEAKLPAFAIRKYGSEDAGKSDYQFILSPFDDFHFNGYSDVGIAAGGKMLNVKRLGWIGLLILVVASFNFMILSNAKISQRLKEVGVRKVLGARIFQLKRQFIIESILVSLIALIFAILTIYYSLPFIEQQTDYQLPINWLNYGTFLPLLTISVIVGVLAGFYPALLLSKLKVVDTFKSYFKVGGNNWTTKASLVFQFALSIGLMSATFIMYQQQNYVFKKNLGFDTEQVVVVPLQVAYGEKEEGNKLLNKYKHELQKSPDFQEFSAMSWSFAKGNEVFTVEQEKGEYDMIYVYRVDPSFVPMMDMELTEGRNFRSELEGEEHGTVLVNEAFLKKYGIEKGEGYKLSEEFRDFKNSTIVGVIKDFHFENLRKAIKPVILTTEEGYMGNILVKIGAKDAKTQLANLEKAWDKVASEKPFKFSFLNEDIQRQYTSENRWNKVFTGATFLTILIACLGLFGLMALTLAERTKEIGVRKILGASLLDIFWMVSKQFVLILLIAGVIAIPFVVYGMQEYLGNFAYRIDIQWFVFLFAVLLTALLAFLVASIQSFKAALQNPVDALRTE